MKASLRSVRIAPKKAQLVAKMIRGLSVPDAMSTLEHTNKKAARLFEDLLRSAMANASHNVQQDPQLMVVKELIVNKAQAYHRGVPMARGRVRPMRKFLSHIDISLGFADDMDEPKKTPAKKSEAKTSKETKKPVEKKATTAKKSSTSTKGKSKTDTAASTSKSSTSKKSNSSSSTKQ